MKPIDVSIESHLMAFAAEQSRLEGRTVVPADFAAGHGILGR